MVLVAAVPNEVCNFGMMGLFADDAAVLADSSQLELKAEHSSAVFGLDSSSSFQVVGTMEQCWRERFVMTRQPWKPCWRDIPVALTG